MNNVAVICCIYNNLPVCEEAVKYAYSLSRVCKQFILVDNHAIDQTVRHWLASLHMGKEGGFGAIDRLTVLDKGENLGCHRGFNAGFAELVPEIEYVVKLDDDTFVRTEGWDEKMREGLIKAPQVAYVSADIDPEAKQQNPWDHLEIDGMKYEVTANGIVGFSCVMFRRSDILKWGPMRGAHEAPGDKGLYGGEEAHYANKAREGNQLVAHFLPVYCDHAKNENRHPDYPMWKWVYGYRRWTELEMAEWIKDPATMLLQYRKRLMEEVRGMPMNVDFVDYTVSRLGKLGEQMDATKIRDIVKTPKMQAYPILQEKFMDVAVEIESRLGLFNTTNCIKK